MEMGTKTKKKLSENILEKFSMDFLRNQVLKNAYGNNDTVIAKLDPRILIVWYLDVYKRQCHESTFLFCQRQ